MDPITIEELKEKLNHDPLFTLRGKNGKDNERIKVEEGEIEELIKRNERLLNNSSELFNSDSVKDCIHTLWILSDLHGTESSNYSMKAYKQSKELDSMELIKASACRVILYEIFSEDEVLNDVLSLKSRPGEFKRNILLSSEALLYIYMRKGIYLEEAYRFCFFSALFGKKDSENLEFLIMNSNAQQSYEEIMIEIRVLAMNGLLSEKLLVHQDNRLLSCIRNENLYLSEQKREKVIEMMKGVKMIRNMLERKNINPSLEIEELILNGVMDEEKLMLIMNSNPSYSNCLRLFWIEIFVKVKYWR